MNTALTLAHGTSQKHCLSTEIVIFPFLTKQLRTDLPVKLVPSYSSKFWLTLAGQIENSLTILACE